MKAVLGADAAVPDRLTGGMRREAKRSRAALAADVCRTPDSRLSSESRRRRNIRFWDRQTSSSGVLPVRPGIFRSEFASDTLPAFDRMDRAPDAPLSRLDALSLAFRLDFSFSCRLLANHLEMFSHYGRPLERRRADRGAAHAARRRHCALHLRPVSEPSQPGDFFFPVRHWRRDGE